MSLSAQQATAARGLPTLVVLPDGSDTENTLNSLARAAGSTGVSYTDAIRKNGKGDLYVFFPGSLNANQEGIVEKAGGRSNVTTQTDWLALRNEALQQNMQMAAGSAVSTGTIVAPQYE